MTDPLKRALREKEKRYFWKKSRLISSAPEIARFDGGLTAFVLLLFANAVICCLRAGVKMEKRPR